ncbi:hypothetical protein C8Q74DRAFT_479655 [Fomes fomentarius]|nr:hypothetical protein C8Q74DRAFT_479655 [Fomes fomentarius]
MGFSGLVRWINAPTTGLDLIAQNILNNHQGQYKGKWQISMKSFRSNLSVPGFQVPERSMCTLTMDDNVFCVVEDPVAPMRRDWVEYAKQNPDATPPTHFRHTFPTLSPPLALEQLLTQLRARWVPVRHTGPSSTGGAGAAGQKGQGAALATGAQLTVEGRVYAIGSDWLVRAGNVIISPGGGMKGMLLEAEYVPLPVMEATFDMQPVLTNLLLSILPNVADPKIVAMTLGTVNGNGRKYSGTRKKVQRKRMHESRQKRKRMTSMRLTATTHHSKMATGSELRGIAGLRT